jgi:hypothetical protein
VLHLKLAKLTFEFWSDNRFPFVPSHVMHPWIQYVSDVIRSLEEAGKVIDLAPSTATATASTAERLGLGEMLRGMNDPSIRSRLLASREERREVFVPSEESISQVRRALVGWPGKGFQGRKVLSRCLILCRGCGIRVFRHWEDGEKMGRRGNAKIIRHWAISNDSDGVR